MRFWILFSLITAINAQCEVCQVIPLVLYGDDGSTSTLSPTIQPSSSSPTAPTSPIPTSQPTSKPTPQPTSNPTLLPTTSEPTSLAPTSQPTTRSPTSQPTRQPTAQPTACTALWTICGGINYAGVDQQEIACCSGTCIRSNAYYWQCRS